jgi:hypothetical protein
MSGSVRAFFVILEPGHSGNTDGLEGFDLYFEPQPRTFEGNQVRTDSLSVKFPRVVVDWIKLLK